jgi:capsular exopolysaccharide synthesis family protein
MGFFYQAMKKATGQPVEDAPESAIDVMPAVEAAPIVSATAPTTPATVTARTAATAAPSRQRLQVPQKVEKLVAVLSPPVLDGHVSAMEECRLIRSRVRETMRARKAKTLMLTSSSAGEGKTLLSVNLAYALSQLENTRILLIDGDLRRPAVSNFLSSHPKYGLGDFLKGTLTFSDICYEVSKSLDVIPAGHAIENSAELLHGQRMQLILAEASARYDLVLIDAPPVFPIADAQVLVPMVDAAVLVVRADVNSYEMAVEAAEILKSKCIGTILNCAKRVQHNDYYTYGKYKVQGAGAGS